VTEATITVRDNPAEQRYELVLDDEVVGKIVYRLRPGAARGSMSTPPTQAICDGSHRRIGFETSLR
jgi:hypothetical protein